MAGNELENAFSTLTQALTLTEREVSEEMKAIEQQIQSLKDRINDLNTQLQTIAHDKESISEMVGRYGAAEPAASQR